MHFFPGKEICSSNLFQINALALDDLHTMVSLAITASNVLILRKTLLIYKLHSSGQIADIEICRERYDGMKKSMQLLMLLNIRPSCHTISNSWARFTKIAQIQLYVSPSVLLLILFSSMELKTSKKWFKMWIYVILQENAFLLL